MSDTTPTPRNDDETPQPEETPLAQETARDLATGEQPIQRSSDPADYTDTAAAPTLDPEYAPVSASDHVAPEPASFTASEPAEPVEPAEAVAPVAEPAAPVLAPAEEAAPQTPQVETAAPVVEEPATPAEPQPAPAAEPTTVIPTPLPSTPSTPTYLNAPLPPKKRGNRGVGILIAVLGTIVFAAANAGATLGVFTLRYGFASAQTRIQDYVMEWSFWLPTAVFLAAFIGLIAVVNRGRWWGYIVGSLAVGALVFAAYFGAAMLTGKFWNQTPDEFRAFVDDFFNSNITYLWVALAAALIARELVLWLGAWISFHGQNTKRRYLEAKAAYDAEYSTAR